MNEINTNSLSRSIGLDKSSGSVTGAKGAGSKRTEPASDVVELSKLPDVGAMEALVEKEFASRRSDLEEKAQSDDFPPLETIDRLATMFALNLHGKSKS